MWSMSNGSNELSSSMAERKGVTGIDLIEEKAEVVRIFVTHAEEDLR